ncbi:MAG: FAD-dependent oxidoreductase [Spirochaetales bacterium]|nr:FAD-dependent oxidoreductase [Spirochaetales bacterium]
MKVLIVGGVAGGASTAARLRRNSEAANIIIFEKGKDISYANCGIPYYIGDVITSRKKLVLVSKEYFKRQLNIEVRVESEVTAINRKRKTITVKNLATNAVYEESYTQLVLSPGASPIRPALPGIDDPRIFTLRNLSDMDAVKTYIQKQKPKKAAVIGAGFIGLEIAENLHKLELEVSIIELARQVMNVFDYEMATFIHQHLRTQHTELFLNDGVLKFEDLNGSLRVVLQSGRSITADLVILALGIKPESGLAKRAGLTLGIHGGIKVNDYLQTNDPSIYALGDAAEITDTVSGDNLLIPLANSANKQGRIIADNICGAKSTYKGTPGTIIAKVFDLTVAMTGNNEKQLKAKNRLFNKVYLSPAHCAEYYPDASELKLKLLYEEKTGLILGAQIIGEQGVDKRIDVIAAMLQNRRTVFDLAELELAYAPPYSSAKDPVNLAGMMAINQMQGKNRVVPWEELPKLKKENALFLDIRTKQEFRRDHIPGAVNIPFSEIRARLGEIPKDRTVILYCYQGKTVYFTLRILLQHGFTSVASLAGSYTLYKSVHAEQEHTGIFENKNE